MNFKDEEKRKFSNLAEFTFKPNAIESGNINFDYLLDSQVLMHSVSSIESSMSMNAVFVPCNMDLINRSFFSEDSYMTYWLDNTSPSSTARPCITVSSSANSKDETNSNTYSASSPRCPEENIVYSSCSSPSVDMPTVESESESKSWDAVRVEDIIKHKLSVSQLVHFGLIDRLISDQNGSRYIQRLLKRSRNGVEVSLLMKYCMDNLDLVELSEDVYGNYIVQLFFTKTNEIEQEILLNAYINDNCLRLSKSMYGCRVIQKCLSSIKNINMLCKMVQCFNAQSRNNGLLSKALLCPYTNHVIQAVLELKLDTQYVVFIQRELERALPFYCEHMIGCRIVQCFIKNYGDRLNVLKLICDDKHLELSKSKYGNYVVQCIIRRDEWYSNLESICIFRNKLIEDTFLSDCILSLSKNKFGSNVVEQCIKVSNEQQRSVLIGVLANNRYIIPSMINHCYGNYVIKALLHESNKKNQLCLIKSIRFYCTNNIIKKDLVKEMNRIRTKYKYEI